jgi:hypothetical protein
MASRKIVIAIALLALGTHPALAGGLPPTTMDSFVYQAGGNADAIYGDESTVIGNGTYSLPPGVSPTPITGFEKRDRIDAGITGTRAAGLTTGHGSYLPDAAGRDEFLKGAAEFSTSGGTAAFTPQMPGSSFSQVPGSSFNQQQLPPNSNPNSVAYLPGLANLDPSRLRARDVIRTVSNGLHEVPNLVTPNLGSANNPVTADYDQSGF